MKKVTATQDGFYGGVRVREGETFQVADNATSKWFVAVDAYVPKKPKGSPRSNAAAARRKAESFVAMVTRETEPVEPETMSEVNNIDNESVI